MCTCGPTACTAARLEDERSCLLVIMGADSQSNKELIAVSDGYRESTRPWKDILLDLSSRGLKTAPQLAVSDGAMGFQAAAAEVWPETRIHRCWFHKSGNVLDKLPKSLQWKAKGCSMTSISRRPARTRLGP